MLSFPSPLRILDRKPEERRRSFERTSLSSLRTVEISSTRFERFPNVSRFHISYFRLLTQYIAAMGATLFPIDSNSDKREEKLRDVTSRIEDLNSVLYTTNQTRRAELARISESISAWWAVVRREKVVFSTLNLWQWDQGRKTLLAEGWVPTRDIPGVQSALRQASVRAIVNPSILELTSLFQTNAGTSVSAILHELKSHKNPPTFHRTNKFTSGFQAIIDSYGVGTYQEINPGLFTIITFPFLFAVMFGDVGHGLLMMLSAASMIAVEKRFKKGTGNEVGPFPHHLLTCADR